MPTKWASYTPEQKKMYSDQNVEMKRNKRQAKLKDEQARNMLASFLTAKTASEKREVIKTFNPYYFTFGETLNPRPQEYEDEDNTCNTNHTHFERQTQGEHHESV